MIWKIYLTKIIFCACLPSIRCCAVLRLTHQDIGRRQTREWIHVHVDNAEWNGIYWVNGWSIWGDEASYKERCRPSVGIDLLCSDIWGSELGYDFGVGFTSPVRQAKPFISVITCVWRTFSFQHVMSWLPFMLQIKSSVGKEETRVCKPKALTFWLLLL